MLIAGEESGDQLGYKLMRALRASCAGDMAFSGIGGFAMVAEGLETLFALSDIAVMGFAPVVRRLPTLLRRINETAQACIAARPDALVLIDAPDFTHRVARKVRRALPDLPIVDYVSPTVWAWRPGRARKMRGYVDHVLALLPFEPDAHLRLGGPPCTYVGHPLIERLPWIAALDTEPLAQHLALPPDTHLIVVLPGSRPSEVRRLMKPFGEALVRLIERGRKFEVVIPVVEAVRGLIEQHLPAWPKQPHLVTGEEDKFRAFKLARAALAASGTVTLELALAGTPMVVAYKVDAVMTPLRRMLKTPSIVLANLVLDEKAFPELIQEYCAPVNLASALAPILDEGPARARQLAALAKIPQRMQLARGTPSEAAADVVLYYAEKGRGWPHPDLLGRDG